MRLGKEYELEKLAEQKANEAQIPVVSRPSDPKSEMGQPLGIPEINFPENLTELTPQQIGDEFAKWTGWALYTNYLLQVTTVREEAAKDVYEYKLRLGMNHVENDVKKQLVEARAEERFPEIKEWRKKYQQERVFRIYLGGHFGQRDNLGGIAGMFKRGADAISRYITLRAMEMEIERSM